MRRFAFVLVLPFLLAWSCPIPDPTPTPTATPANPCPEGQCLVGWTNSVPPNPICEPCVPPPADCRTTGCPEGQTCELKHGAGWTCVAPEPPPTYPVRFPILGAVLSLNNKAYGKGFDSTLLVEGDPGLCLLLHGQTVNKCHFDSAVFTSELQRAGYEMEVMGGARVGVTGVGPRCPVWQYLSGSVWPCNDDHDAIASCDHFGRPQVIDDPKTPTTGDTLLSLQGFEGEPKECGLQRNEFGPMAGFFTIAHGKAQIRACLPLDNTTCGPWRPFDK